MSDAKSAMRAAFEAWFQNPYERLDEAFQEDWRAAWEAALEEAARIIEGGSFMHDQAPTALFAKEAAAAIRRAIER